jgi:sulfide:quinone oxidoreductase
VPSGWSGSAPPKVLIVGGGVAALETALALRAVAGERPAIELCAPRDEFLYRPFAVGEPFGAGHVLRYDLRELTEYFDASFRLGGVAAVDAERREATDRDGERIAYDYLVLATGARALWAVPGADTFWGVADEDAAGKTIHRLRAGKLHDVVFAVPDGPHWALPPYELALLAAAALERAGASGAKLTVLTPEDAPLGIFGRRVGEQMRELLAERGVELIADAHPVEFSEGRLRIAPGDPVATEAVISLPRLEGRRIEGVPHDERDFVPVGEGGRVPGVERVFAAGEATEFPVKHGGIATQQADAVAATIAFDAGLGPEPEPFDPVLRGVLWTGAEPRYLYGSLSGKHGEASALSAEPPWPESESKIIGRHLTPFLVGVPDAEGRAI